MVVVGGGVLAFAPIGAKAKIPPAAITTARLESAKVLKIFLFLIFDFPLFSQKSAFRQKRGFCRKFSDLNRVYAINPVFFWGVF